MTKRNKPAKTGIKQVGKWEKGQSGNLKGRPQGSRNNATILLEKMLTNDGKDVVRAVVKAAKNGDMAAARLVLDRIIPVRKGRAIKLNLPEVNSPRDVMKALSAAIRAMADGELTPEEANMIAALLEAHRKAIETFELESRLTDLEQRAKEDQ